MIQIALILYVLRYPKVVQMKRHVTLIMRQFWMTVLACNWMSAAFAAEAV
jgi:hypothetical protein